MFTITSPVTARYADALAKAKAAKDQAEADYRAAVDALAGILGHQPGTYDINGVVLNLSENNTYDEKVMTEALLPGQVRRCSTLKLDKAAVKRLYPDVYAKAKVNKGVKVTVR